MGIVSGGFVAVSNYLFVETTGCTPEAHEPYDKLVQSDCLSRSYKPLMEPSESLTNCKLI